MKFSVKSVSFSYQANDSLAKQKLFAENLNEIHSSRGSDRICSDKRNAQWSPREDIFVKPAEFWNVDGIVLGFFVSSGND